MGTTAATTGNTRRKGRRHRSAAAAASRTEADGALRPEDALRPDGALRPEDAQHARAAEHSGVVARCQVVEGDRSASAVAATSDAADAHAGGVDGDVLDGYAPWDASTDDDLLSWVDRPQDEVLFALPINRPLPVHRFFALLLCLTAVAWVVLLFWSSQGGPTA